MNTHSLPRHHYSRIEDLSHCLKPCKNCDMTVRVLVAVKNDGYGIAALVNDMMDECDVDDISLVFRVDGTDQVVKCRGRCVEKDDTDEYLF